MRRRCQVEVVLVKGDAFMFTECILVPLRYPQPELDQQSSKSGHSVDFTKVNAEMQCAVAA